MAAPQNDLALSAVPYDSILVREFAGALAPRVRGTVTAAADAQPDASRLTARQSRLAVVLHQRLWGVESETRADAAVLRTRVTEDAESVLVVRLDAATPPEWLSKSATCAFGTIGLDGSVECIAKRLAALGGSPLPAVVAAPPVSNAQRPRSFDEAPGFLSQGRAFSTLRRELDSLSSELEPRLDAEEARRADGCVELHSQPNRVVARVGDVGVSFSWVAGRLGTVADGRLLVIEWSGVQSVSRGSAVLNAATPTRETVYHAEGTGAENWQWRSDERHGRASSTANLVAEWVASATMSLES